MDTLCDKNFNLILYYYKNKCKESLDIQLTPNLEQLLEDAKGYTLSITENTTYELDFIAKDSKARLYIEGIDQVEESYYDEAREQHYILPSNEPVIWFKWDVTGKGMIPGSYYIKVVCYGKWYYGILKVEPRHMETFQLDQMKEEVRDLISRWKELPQGIQESVQQKNFYNEASSQQRQIKILVEWYTKLIPLLSDFKRIPYEQLQKAYHYMPKEMSRKIDQTAIRKTLMKATDSNKAFSYTKSMTYETQENKWIKCFNERLLNLIRKLTTNVKEVNEKEIIKQVEVACQQLKNCEWYQKIACQLYEELPIRSRYDSRYRTLFQLDNELWASVKPVGLKRSKEYLWLETSWIYELWCFLQIYKTLIEDLGYQEVDSIKSGYVFKRDDLTLKLHYDAIIPLHIEETNRELCPLYVRSPLHTIPDGRLDIYKQGQYYGSIVLEFKYSNYYNVWNDYRKTRCSEQLLHYGYQLGSPYLINHYRLPEQVLRQMNPIHKVIAIMPRLQRDSDLIEDRETNIVQIGLRLGKNNVQWKSYIEALVKQVTLIPNHLNENESCKYSN